jgi:DNA-binding transcriptional ArsR family regulator
MKCYSYNTFFETIGNKTRLRILELLMAKPMSVTEIHTKLGEEQSKISHNLKKLADCHFIDAKKEGKKRVYSLNKETIFPLMNLVGKHVSTYCCKECKMKNELKGDRK